MGYNINISVKNVENLRKLGNMIAELVENATGQKVNIFIHDKSKMLQKQNNQMQNINRKLMK